MKKTYIFFVTAWAIGLVILQYYPSLSKEESKVAELVIDMLQTKMYLQVSLLIFPVACLWYLATRLPQVLKSDKWPPEDHSLPDFLLSMGSKWAQLAISSMIAITMFFLLLQCLQVQDYAHLLEALNESSPPGH